jgi:hypothetical protein
MVSLPVWVLAMGMASRSAYQLEQVMLLALVEQ